MGFKSKKESAVDKVYPLRNLWDGRKPTITSGFKTHNPDRTSHDGVDFFYRWLDADIAMPTSDGGAIRKNGRRKWWIPPGTVAVAAASGVVSRASRIGTGWRCWVDHGNGERTGYFHGSTLLVKKGDTVAAGEPLLIVGDSPTGNDGTHLHFEVSPILVYEPKDPRRWLRGARHLPAEEANETPGPVTSGLSSKRNRSANVKNARNPLVARASLSLTDRAALQPTIDAMAELPGVVCVCVGAPRRKGRWHNNDVALCVHVQKKRPLGELDVPERLEEQFPNIPLDILEVGTPKAHYLDAKDMVKASGGRSGAITCLTAYEGTVYALLSGHVVLPYAGHAIRRDYSGGCRVDFHDAGGAYYTGVVVAGHLGEGRAMDYALVKVDTPAVGIADLHHVATRGYPPHRIRSSFPAVNAELTQYSPLSGRRRPFVGRRRQQSISTIQLELPDGTLGTYDDTIVVDSTSSGAFSRPGDSGSLVVDTEKRVVGTVLGGDDAGTIQYVLPIWEMQNKLGEKAKWFWR